MAPTCTPRALRAALLVALLAAMSASAALTPLELSAQMGLGLSTSWFKSSKWSPEKYSTKFLAEAKERGLSHLRLRVRADIYGFKTDTYDKESMMNMLDNLEMVVADCIEHGIVPVISWIHHEAEVNGRPEDGDNYVRWWRIVARRFMDAPFELTFNLFTELGVGAVRDVPAIYNDWTKRAVSAIRGTGGNNEHRVIILGSPGKTSKNLYDVDTSILLNDLHLMVEWHIYASGPNKSGGQKNWEGTGSEEERAAAREHITTALEWGRMAGVLTYMGAWMPMDNIDGSLEQDEVEAFAKFFANELAAAGIPSTVNTDWHYYDETKQVWPRRSVIGGRSIQVRRVLNKMLAGYKSFSLIEASASTIAPAKETTTAATVKCPSYRDCNCPDHGVAVYSYDNNGCPISCRCKRV
eukprot:m.246425 g.246425  ORF g.246425 m.246425 type:complete len:410 (+) comp10968_c1_seq1:838-2067(+)